MKSFIRFALGQGVLINVLFFGLLLFGLFYAVPKIPVDRYPNIAFGEVSIDTGYPGAAPDEVESQVTQRIEDAIRGMKGIEFVKSSSLAGNSNLQIKFIDDTDYDTLYDRLRIRVLGIQINYQWSMVNHYSQSFRKLMWMNGFLFSRPILLPVIRINHSLSERSACSLKISRTRLETVDGIKEVTLLGDEQLQYRLAINPAALEQERLSFDQVVAAMRQHGFAPPAGTIDTSNGSRLIRIDHRFRDFQELHEVIIATRGDGQFIRIADLLDFSASGLERMPNGVILTVNGEDTVGCKIAKETLGQCRRCCHRCA